MDLSRKLTAELLGTFWLVLGGCGSAVLAAGVPTVGIGYAGVALAFGLTVVTGAYAFGHISGAHFNPAVSVGLWAGGRFPAKDVIPYVAAQLVGGVARRSHSFLHRKRCRGLRCLSRLRLQRVRRTLAAALFACRPRLMCETVLTFMFLIVIFGATSKSAPKGFAPLAIGLALTLIHLISIPVTNTSVNPARSTAVALFQGTWALQQLWAFWVMPLIGAGLAGLVQRGLDSARDSGKTDSETPEPLAVATSQGAE